MSDDELNPDDPLNAAVSALRQTPPIADGLVERTRQRGITQRRRRTWITGSGGVLGSVALTLLLIRGGGPGPGQITFALVAPASAGVSLVGDFNDWDSDRTQLEQHGDEWSVTLDLEPGRYRFAYVTDDGEWHADPSAAPTLDEFGAPTSVVTVAGE